MYYLIYSFYLYVYLTSLMQNNNPMSYKTGLCVTVDINNNQMSLLCFGWINTALTHILKWPGSDSFFNDIILL